MQFTSNTFAVLLIHFKSGILFTSAIGVPITANTACYHPQVTVLYAEIVASVVANRLTRLWLGPFLILFSLWGAAPKPFVFPL